MSRYLDVVRRVARDFAHAQSAQTAQTAVQIAQITHAQEQFGPPNHCLFQEPAFCAST
jgi:hypothetical protein